eukprot:g16198.t1
MAPRDLFVELPSDDEAAAAAPGKINKQAEAKSAAHAKGAGPAAKKKNAKSKPKGRKDRKGDQSENHHAELPAHQEENEKPAPVDHEDAFEEASDAEELELCGGMFGRKFRAADFGDDDSDSDADDDFGAAGGPGAGKSVGDWNFSTGGVLKQQNEAGDSLADKIKRRLALRKAEEADEAANEEDDEADVADVGEDSGDEAAAAEDLLATAETGSGKTAAFLLPILERISRSPHVAARKRIWVKGQGYKVQTGKIATKALVLLPTRELATQCFSMLQSLSKYSLVTSSLIAGGFSAQDQASSLKNQPDVLICTPGRILDHLLNTQSVHLEMLEIVVFDEADRLLEMGFRDEYLLTCKEVLRRCSHGRQTLLFSATWNTDVQDLASVALTKPLRVEANKVNQVARNLKQEFVQVDEESTREATVLHLCQHTYKANAIVFFQTKKQCHRMAILFGLFGLNFAELHGNLSQTERCENVQKFAEGKVQYLLATDLAARGLDLRNVECVVNYEVPNEDAKYIHRCGRTARMGATGQSVTLWCGGDEYKRVKKLAKLCAKKEQGRASKVGAGANANTSITKRSVNADSLQKISNQVYDFEGDVIEVLEEEKWEREMRLAAVELTKAENMEKHGKEIAGRPKKVWRLTNNEKEQFKQSEREIRESLKEDGKKESRKQKRKRMDREEERAADVRRQKTAKRKNKVTGAADRPVGKKGGKKGGRRK